MKKKFEPCPICGGTDIKVEMWSSGGPMVMVKCNNPDCLVPPESYPKGRNLEQVTEEWNRYAKGGAE